MAAFTHITTLRQSTILTKSQPALVQTVLLRDNSEVTYVVAFVWLHMEHAKYLLALLHSHGVFHVQHRLLPVGVMGGGVWWGQTGVKLI